jgi:hypothetical protein
VNRGYILDITQVAYEVIQGFVPYGGSMGERNYVELLCIWQVLHEKYSLSGFFFVWGKNELC